MSGFKHFFSPILIHTSSLQVRGIGVREIMPPCQIVRPQGSGDFLFMLFHDPVTLTASGATSAAPAGSLVLWPPGAEQRYGSTAPHWSHSWIHCKGDRVADALRTTGLPANHLLRHPSPRRWVAQLNTLYAEIVSPRPDPVIVGNLLENTLRDIARLLAPDPVATAQIPAALLELRQRLERAPQQPVRLADLAHAVHLSVPHLSALWRRHFQVSPIEDVIRMRIEHAKHLLLDENRRIRDVARAVGMDDPYHFSKLFSKRVGRSPRAYRATHQSGSRLA